jgi:hypothetical protein
VCPTAWVISRSCSRGAACMEGRATGVAGTTLSRPLTRLLEPLRPARGLGLGEEQPDEDHPAGTAEDSGRR